MRERLRKVPEQPPGFGVVLLRQQAEIVAEIDEALEELERLVVTAEQLVAVAEPERARQDPAFAAGYPVGGRLARLVAAQEAAVQELALDCLDRAADPRV